MNTKTVMFGEVKTGQEFVYEGNEYRKIKQITDASTIEKYNAICKTLVRLSYFIPYEKVQVEEDLFEVVLPLGKLTKDQIICLHNLFNYYLFIDLLYGESLFIEKDKVVRNYLNSLIGEHCVTHSSYSAFHDSIRKG